MSHQISRSVQPIPTNRAVRRGRSAGWHRWLFVQLPVVAALVGALIGSAPAPAQADPSPLLGGQLSHRLSREVVGYLPYWELSDETVAALDYGRLTTIALFSVGMDGDGHLITDAAGYRALGSSQAATVISAAHAAGVRVIISFTSFGLDKNAAFFANATAQATFVREAAALVTARGLDGADFDVELLSAPYYGAFAVTAGALRNALRATNPIAYTTVATNGNTSGARMAAAALAAGVDRAFLMGYAYRTAGSSPGSIDPRVSATGGLSLSTSLDLYASYSVPLGSVLLGLPFYGRTWQTTTTAMRAPKVSGTSGEVFLNRNLSTLTASSGIVANDYDAVESSARIVRTEAGKIYQTYYDNVRSYGEKFALVFARNLAGIGFWTLGYDRGHPDYWSLVGKTFGPPVISGVRIVPSPTNTRNVTVQLSWTNRDRPATQVRLANGSAAFSSWRTIAPQTTWTLPAATSPIWRTIRIQIRDAADARSAIVTAKVLYDPSKPVMTRLSLWWSTTMHAWRIRYAASDTGSGVAAYRIRVYRNGTWTTLATARTRTTFTLSLPHSARFTVAVNAIDRAHNSGRSRFAVH